MKSSTFISTIALIIGMGGLSACVVSNTRAHSDTNSVDQPSVETRAKPTLKLDGLTFKDLNDNGSLDPYEDWRLTPEDRAADLVSRMTLAEKVGTMLIATQNPECDGSITEDGRNLMIEQHMSRFILRASVTKEPADCSVELEGFRLRGGYVQTPRQMAGFLNDVQALREASRLGIPALFKDNYRNHVENQPMFGIGVGAGAMSEFPKPAGLSAAALGAGTPTDAAGTIPDDLQADLALIADFAGVVGEEWRALGLRGLYGYTIDLATEPRWSRVHETFSEDADLTADITRVMINTLQGPIQANGLALSDETNVSLTTKHFPGGGPQYMGWDPHYTFGKSQVYTSDHPSYGFDYHMKPFVAAIEAGVGAIMPYYGVPREVTYEGEEIAEEGMAFSHQIITEILRGQLGFAGYVNSDSGIVEERSWGLEDFRTNPETGEAFTIEDRIAAAVKVGTDVFSEFNRIEPILNLVETRRLDEAANIDPAVKRLLVEQFALGLFENPYVDVDAAETIIGSAENRALGLDVQRKSVVLLQNEAVNGEPVLPLAEGSKIYALGFGGTDLEARGYPVVHGDVADGEASARTPVPEDTDFAIVNVSIATPGSFGYRSQDVNTGGREISAQFQLIDESTGEPQKTWSAQDPCVYADTAEGEEVPECLDDMMIFGGSFPWEVNNLSLSAIASSQSWQMTPSLADIQAVMSEIGDPSRVIISIEFRNPYVLDEESGILESGAILATFGVSDEAQLDVITGKVAPVGRLPFALPKTQAAVMEQASDAPGYDETRDGALFPYGFGLGYPQ